ncbi:glutathione peroxidase, partial [Listeria monocytogenes]|nr:glutathione peroxidase [Listeria monocytogenes]
EIALSDYNGKVLLNVNTASKWGLTPQLEGLEAMYKKLGGANFEILGFPGNQFLRQDPGSDEEIVEFCQMNYGGTFQM